MDYKVAALGGGWAEGGEASIKQGAGRRKALPKQQCAKLGVELEELLAAGRWKLTR